MNFVEELRWRGMIHDIMPGVEEQLNKGMITAYVGIDPTADSLHIGHLVSVMMLTHLQKAGHRPLALVGGATAMIGDPSGKAEERKLLSDGEVRTNEQAIRKQLEKFLDFKCGKNSAEIVNNNDWFKDITLISFLRDVGKHLTVSYLLGKGFVKERIERELSFTEFNYILMQAYDFMWLHRNKNCMLQMGGSDQWGNITAGTELIRKKLRQESFGMTCPLITKADGGKFGKTEEGNIWLDPRKTSPYKFYQFWLNVSDGDAAKYLRIFTLLSREEISQLEEQHQGGPHLRVLQKALAKDVTVRIHSLREYELAVEASGILFGKGTPESLGSLPEETLLSVMEGVPRVSVPLQSFKAGINIIDLLTESSGIFPSRGEARKMLAGGGVFLNKEKLTDPALQVSAANLLNNKYLLVQKGKKNYYLFIAG